VPSPTSTVPVYVILAGGSGVDIINTSNNSAETNATYANQTPLGLYSNWAISQGYTPIPINYPGTKIAQREAIIAEILMHPGALFILVGHSSGGDSSILTKNDPRVSASIIKTILLDPTLTAGGLGLPNDSITSLYDNIDGPNVYLGGTSQGMGINYLNTYVNVENRFGVDGNPFSIVYDPPVTDHTAMAIDVRVLESVLTWLESQ
jgi:hypothetical protein